MQVRTILRSLDSVSVGANIKIEPAEDPAFIEGLTVASFGFECNGSTRLILDRNPLESQDNADL